MSQDFANNFYFYYTLSTEYMSACWWGQLQCDQTNHVLNNNVCTTDYSSSTSEHGWLLFPARCPASMPLCLFETLSRSVCESTTIRASGRCSTRPNSWWSLTSRSDHSLSTYVWTKIAWKPPTTSQFTIPGAVNAMQGNSNLYKNSFVSGLNPSLHFIGSLCCLHVFKPFLVLSSCSAFRPQECQ